ncbi:ATP synthase F1 subunit epsilon [Patescibacteria group bacterium]|nr:ATP synthase F1 subunit epsilon [Patescibacteria group bacterium]MCL5797629.1 ATP synthase F1 subunit epsilon [Patescibacteria group bacterium]
MNTFPLEIITPERIAFTDEVEMVVTPTATGIVGILHGHVPFFSRLTEGEVKIVKKGEDIYLAIGGGFIEVTPQKTTILVTSAYHAEEINEKEVLEAKERAEAALKSKPSGTALLEAQALFRRSVIALKVLRRRRPRSMP